MKNLIYETLIVEKGRDYFYQHIIKQTNPKCGPFSLDDEVFDYLTEHNINYDDFCDYIYL